MSEQAKVPSHARPPNQYHLQGGGISLSYYPDGAGPIIGGQGPVILTYQDSARTLTFRANDVRVDKNDDTDLGSVVSVTITETVDTGGTTFSLVVPPVILRTELPIHAPIDTIGITAIHHLSFGAMGNPQKTSYVVTNLSGIASAGILPD